MKFRFAFTLLELIFVIIVVGILAVVLYPRIGTQNLDQAASKFIETIRYTQHLAMIDDKFAPDEKFTPYDDSTRQKKATQQWFKQWWAFQVWSYNGASYSSACDRRGPGLIVFSDKPSKNAGNYEFNTQPSLGETAKDPFTKKRMAACITESSYVNDEYNLYKSFNIEKIIISTPCTVRKNYLVFDELGRPHCMYPQNSNDLQPYKYIINTQVKYTLCANSSCDENRSICVEPRTGFVHRCD